MKLTKATILLLGSVITLFSCQTLENARYGAWSEWQPPQSPIAKDEQIEARIDQMVSALSLEQKIGQMIQADIGSVSVEDIKRYRIGSVLNGGGQTPKNRRNANASEWVELADQLYKASMAPEDDIIPIPLIWGVDAVHGHGNVRGATLYPHNIGLGATRNPKLVKQIAAATAIEVAATGIDWDFAPTVAVAKDARWGRTYESYSSNPELVALLGAAAVEGLQGIPQEKTFLDHHHVIATAKHFIGDGGTQFGDDQGFVVGREKELLQTHLPGYISAMESGVQTIMASYSWWNGKHSHENARLMTKLLKQHLGFDGVIVSDWQGIGYVPECTIDRCAKAINAGIDLFMIPNAPDWQNFYQNTLQQVKDGEISISRIDDAVRRILRVKMRAGLWEKPSPAARPLSGRQTLIGHKGHRKLARQAVRESLVLLKNQGVLPIKGTARVVVSGPGADNIPMQSGGWSVTWTGTDTQNSDFPGATSIRAGLARALQSQGGKLVARNDVTDAQSVDVAVVVFGESPYAEMWGDIENLATLEVDQMNKNGLKEIRYYADKGIPVVAVLLSGRPLWVNQELNEAAAFVAAWLPGTEGSGIADVLVGNKQGAPRHEFKGKLSFPWPATPCASAFDLQASSEHLFPYDYGLSYNDHAASSPWTPLDESNPYLQLGCVLKQKAPHLESYIFNEHDEWQFVLEKKSLEFTPLEAQTTLGGLSATDNRKSGNGIKLAWHGDEPTRLALRNGQLRNNFLPYLAANALLSFKIKINAIPTQPLFISTFSGHSAANEIDIAKQLKKQHINQWQELRIDLQCYSDLRFDMTKVQVPFAIQYSGELELEIKDIAYAISATEQANLTCH